MAPRKMKQRTKQVKEKIEKEKEKENGECLREEQRKIRAKFAEMERQGDRLRAETEMLMKQTARTQIKMALMFNILKAREHGHLIEASTLARFLRELVAKERAKAGSNDV
ncbi:uncharacterized protein LOC120188613 [Hibiscus syriacus]|uniref:uncharacterized protein LOC120188613 n=1 Tax=Hibiscus syriacus TaxID=106335 RepID=UPI0019211051|nr:uncharacterized protein LOC120188613 [Hibiscus syriacus]